VQTFRFALLLWLQASLLICAGEFDQQWPAWRGPRANGFAPNATPPIQWSESSNIRWKLPLPGKGHSTPIIFGDTVYLTAAVPVGDALPPVHDDAPGVHDSVPVTHRHQFVLYAINRKDGKIRWQRNAREAFPHEGGHVTGSLASNSPVTDGQHIYAMFGSRGLFCYDLQGKLIWQKDLGRMHTLHAHGEGSSPVIYKDTLVVVWDHEGDSYLYTFDKNTGTERIKIKRDEKTAWATPLVIEQDGRPQIITSATQRIRANDLATGEQIWELGGMSQNVVSSPVALPGMIVAGSSYDRASMYAIRLDGAKGDLASTTNVAWSLTRLTPYVSSPLLFDDTLYFIRHNQNILSRMDPATGKFRGDPIRLEGIRDFIFASPVGAAGRIYIPARDGVTVVLSHDAKNAQLAVNKLDDSFSASPALIGSELYLRGEKALYCISEVTN
jgi:outer membrane protein assembly factor BamB